MSVEDLALDEKEAAAAAEKSAAPERTTKDEADMVGREEDRDERSVEHGCGLVCGC